MATARIDSSAWLRHAFLISDGADVDYKGNNNNPYTSGGRRRQATSAAFKFTNTTLGGNFAINNPPQFTRYADIRHPGRGRSEEQLANGMGRYYSEAIDDPKQMIHMSFGVPQYSSWTGFFSNFYDRNAALLANTGKVSDKWYNVGLVTGYIVTLPLQPFVLGITAASRVYNFLTNSRPSKWYYFKPTMHSYWSAVNVIANELAIGLNLIPRVGGADDKTDRHAPGQRASLDDVKRMSEMYPDIFRKEGGVDVYALATRTQRMSDHAQRAEKESRERANNLDELKLSMQTYANKAVKDPDPNRDGHKYFLDYVRADQATTADLTATDSFSNWSDLNGIYNFMRASQRDGSQFVTYRVNHTGSVSESFNNSTRESDVAQKLNATVSQGRSASFNFMGGNVTGFVGDIVDSIKSVAAGVLDSVNMGGLATLAGTAFIDVPKLWDGSTASLPRAEYTIPLPNAYGNKLSRFMNLYIPIAMLLAGALPLSAGRSAYTSPFICQIYHQGRVQCQLGMIDSLTITRGTGNVGWNAEHEMLGAEVTISVVDLSSILHIPIKGGFNDGDWLATGVKGAVTATGEAIGGGTGAVAASLLVNSTVWDEQSLFSDYMAVLSSMSVADSYYVGKRLNLNLTRALASYRTWKSPSNWMSMGMDTGPVRLVSGLAQYTGRF